jgi:hypothetical protein
MKCSPSPKSSSDSDWKKLYIAALFENDKSKLAEKISRAKAAIVARRRKSMASGGNVRERQVLDTALFSLHALASCFSLTNRIAA